ncbi:MAG: glycosyltransferase, partial [Candidatus Hodarchaeota archaeon]
PYENSGHILDYLLENFHSVYLFSIAFHALGRAKVSNKISIFKKGKLITEKCLYYMSVPEIFVFLFVPIRSVVNLIQIIFNSMIIHKKYGKISYFFSVNGYTAFVGLLLKKMGIVGKTIFWVWDYYPVNDTCLFVNFMRWLYWHFDKFATYSDKVIYLNKRLVEVRKAAKLISKNARYPLVPIGMGEVLPVRPKNLEKIKIGFIGVLKKSQGIDMLIDSAGMISRNFTNFSFEIIGSGPDELYFKRRAEKSAVKFNFYGFVSENKFKDILYDCTIGVAPYSPGRSNVSRYSDPGKVKRYLEFNLPSIITDVFEFSKELEKSGAGLIIKYGDNKALTDAIKKIVSNYKSYVGNTVKLHNKFYYRNIYSKMFDNL